MITIDEYSVAAIPIEMRFNDTSLSVGTAFVWENQGHFFLITNWHNASGRNAATGKHLSATAAEPNFMNAWLNVKGQLGNKVRKQIALRQTDGSPRWLVHRQHGAKIDVVAVPLDTYADVDMHPINGMAHDDLAIHIGMDVFVLGFPFGLSAGPFPVWKRGSIASEPNMAPEVELHMLVDTASRPGMSGSPVVRRSWGSHMMQGGGMNIGTGAATKFVGVYSGRLATKDPLDAQLGIVWPASLVPEIVESGRLDTLN